MPSLQLPPNSSWKSVLKPNQTARILSKRPRLCSRSTASRSSRPRKANVVGRQGPQWARHVSAALRKSAGLIVKPMPLSPIGARARRHPRSRVQISKQTPLEAGAGPLLERRHDKIHQVAFRRPCQGSLPETGGAPCLAAQPANGRSPAVLVMILKSDVYQRQRIRLVLRSITLFACLRRLSGKAIVRSQVIAAIEES